MAKKNIFITGGAGFIGSHIVRKTLSDGHKVTVYDNFSSGLKGNLDLENPSLNVVEGDISDTEKLTKSMPGHDMIFHEAAQLEITTSIDSTEKDINTNIIGSLNVIRAARKNGIHKLIMASSACVYGEPESSPVVETDLTRPNWEYGVSKLAVEKYSDIYAGYEGMQIANLRYSIVYGENEWYGRVLTIFLKRALEGKDIVIFGSGTALRDFIHVDDVTEFNRLLVEKDWTGHEIFNVSTGMVTSIKELADIVRDIKHDIDGADVKITHENVQEGSFSKLVEGRIRLPRELTVMHLNSDKATRFADWQAKTHLRDGIRRQYLWLKNNPNRWVKMSY